jgi:NAD(P)-dependent dehydrogenase (short-subunit alcohol dehydrogenase family)
MNPGRLEGKRIVVVGAGQRPGDSTGNGRAVATLYAREGARLQLVDINEHALDETINLIGKDSGARCERIVADATREADCAEIVRRCVEAYGGVDVLHNNVGTVAGDSPVADMDERAWDRIFATNLKATALCCKHAIRAMREQGAGTIVNTSSIASKASMGIAAYQAANAAVNALTRHIAITYARDGIRANALLPGLLHTPMGINTYATDPEEQAKVIAKRNALVPLNAQMGTAWDVAAAAVFLASEESAWISGALVPVDGAQLAQVGIPVHG